MEKTCTGCGEVKDRLADFARWDALCHGCRAATPGTSAERCAHRIETWWAEGATIAEIAERLGRTPASTNHLIGRLRREGYDLAPREPGWNRRRARSQKLVRPRAEVA